MIVFILWLAFVTNKWVLAGEFFVENLSPFIQYSQGYSGSLYFPQDCSQGTGTMRRW